MTHDRLLTGPPSLINMNLLKRAAIAQLCSGPSKFKNLIDIAKCAGWAKRDGATMLFLPEGLGFLGNNSQETIQNAESAESLEAGLSTESFIDVEPWCKSLCHAIHTHASTIEGNPPIVYSSSDDAKDIHNENVSIIRGLQTIARESGLWISGGGVHILGAPTTIDSLDDENKTPRVYNTHLILNNYGQVVASYRKIHLFEVSIPTQNLRFRESSYTAAGDQLVLCSSPIGTLGLSTCFDVRFPEMYTALRNAGADILLVPSAFTVPTGQAHWHTLLRARAIENQCYVIAAAQYGQHNEKRQSYGHSLSVDPWGKLITDAGGYDSHGSASPSLTVPSVTYCDIDQGLLEEVRERMPLYRPTFSF